MIVSLYIVFNTAKMASITQTSQANSLQSEIFTTVSGLVVLFVLITILNALISIVMDAVCPKDPYRQALKRERCKMRKEDKYPRTKRSITPERKSKRRKRHRRSFMLAK